jgi:hypothetical protein
MDVPAPGTTVEGLGELRRKLQGELEGLERQLLTLTKEIEAKKCALELVEVTERQMAVQGRGQPDLEGAGPEASTQVRGSSQAQDITASPCNPCGAGVLVL